MVLVCNDPPFIYLKTRKTAGTSVEMALEPLCVPSGTPIVEHRPASFTDQGIVGRRGGDFAPRGPLRNVSRLLEWRNHQGAAFVHRKLGRAEWDARPKIACIRNPFDRVVSYFHWSGQRAGTDEDFARTRARFHDWVTSRKWHDDREIVFLKGRFIIDHAIRFEHLAGDLARVAAALGLAAGRIALPLTKSMAKARKAHDVPDYFDRDTIEAVKSRMSWVFDHYDYPLEPQARRPAAVPSPEPAP